jgi:hypothetical protein
MQLPDIIKSSRVLVIKLKKEWRKEKAGEGKDGKLGDRDKKRKGWFSRWRYGRSRCRLCWRYTRNRRLHEALENELNKQGLGGSGQNALEKMKR